MREIINKLIKGNAKAEESDSKIQDDIKPAAEDQQDGSPEISEVGSDGSEEKAIERTIEMLPTEPSESLEIKDPKTSDTSPIEWNDGDSARTKPLAPRSQDTLVGASSGKNADIISSSSALTAIHKCHVGNHRARNEDSTYLFTAESGGEVPLLPLGLYIIADGMGGHHDGHEASKKVSRLVASNVLEQIYMPMLDTRRTASSIQHKPILEVMSDAIQTANQEIYNPEPSKDSGTTLTAGLIFGQRIFIAHIGDSRAYLLVDGELTLATTDHSYVRRLIDAGQLTEEEAAVHPQRNMLYKAVGQGGTLEIDTFTRSLPKEGMLVLCSDGLWGLVNDSDMREVITSDRSYQAMVDELVEMALRAGGHDNVSVVLVVFSF